MAIPIGFRQANTILQRPTDTTAEECKSLEVFTNGEQIISRWQFTDEEIEELKRNGGKVYLSLMGQTMPPAFVLATSPFEEAAPTKEDG